MGGGEAPGGVGAREGRALWQDPPPLRDPRQVHGGGGEGVGLLTGSAARSVPALRATQGQIDGSFSQLPFKCHQNRLALCGRLT